MWYEERRIPQADLTWHRWHRVRIRVLPLVACLGLLALLASAAGLARGAASGTVVGATVLTSTSIDVSGCSGAATTFGIVPSATTVVTGADCAIGFGSSNAVAQLRTRQLDTLGDAMERTTNQSELVQSALVWNDADPLPDGSKLFLAGTPAFNTEKAPIAASTDGGVTWTIGDVGVTGRATAISAGSSSRLWAGGTFGIRRSVDGGSSWNSQATVAGFNSANQVVAIDDNVVWANGNNRIIRTANGGASWSTTLTIVSPLNLAAFDALDATHAVAGGFDAYTGATMLWLTSDGGATWTDVSGALPASVAISDLEWTSTNVLWVKANSGTWRSIDGAASFVQRRGGDNAQRFDARSDTDVIVADSNGNVAYTSDGGATWTARSLTQTGVSHIGTIEWHAPGDILAAGQSEMTTRSSDGGSTWGVVNAGKPFWQAVARGSGSGNDAWIVGRFGRAAHTLDAGATWDWIGTIPGMGSANDVVVADELVVVVGAGGLISTTSDGGATWVARTSGTTQSFNAVTTADGDVIIAAATAGVLRRSTDGGVTWSAVTSGTASSIGDISTGDDQTFVGTISGAAVVVSTDRGVTWTTRATGASFGLTGVSVASDHSIWVTTTRAQPSNAEVWRSIDDGVTWTRLTDPIGGGFFRVPTALSKDVAWVLSEVWIFRTTDGGATWTQISTTRPQNHVIRLVALDQNRAVGVGTSNVVMRVVPTNSLPDVNGTTNTLGTGSTAFGACLRSGASLTPTWTDAGGTCSSAVNANWNDIPISWDQIATTTGTGINSTANLRWGMRTGPAQPPGAYIAQVEFGVIAP
ncbi:MAG: glycosyl hydrolase, repeat-containing protein [Thermoleophilia bacterium]|nr:glycosyl hydrolase, repeat-containing protein [Thermoleophilia bacterium]